MLLREPLSKRFVGLSLVALVAVSISRTVSKRSRVQLAAYRDSFENTAVWGSGNLEELRWLAGRVLPNPAAQGLTINAGDYQSSGVRAAYALHLGSNIEAAMIYALGEALAADASADGTHPTDLRSALRTASTQSAGGRFSARIPVSRTVLTASYFWLPRGRVTSVDPYGQASLGMHPYLDLQVRQPLPSITFIPAHIEALADFRNLLEQGYVPVPRPPTAVSGAASLCSSNQISLSFPSNQQTEGDLSAEMRRSYRIQETIFKIA